MPGDVSHHRLIARPPGLPGYQPGRWCAVCGKTTSNRTIIDCSSGDCPNTSHTNCLGDNSTFDCCEVSALRTAQGITSPVVYQLDPRELVENIRQLRKELKRKKNILSFFEATSQTLAEKRDAVVTVLDLIDNICATRSSAEELDTRSIAATAKPHRIDEEWDRQVASRERGKLPPKKSTEQAKTTLYLFKVSVDSFLLLLIPLVLPYPSLSPVTGLQDIHTTPTTVLPRSRPPIHSPAAYPIHTAGVPRPKPGVMPGRKSRDQLTIVSANVRGLLTNIGDLVIPRTPDIVATVETFMNESVPDNFGHMKGYTRWHRRDRTHGTFGGVAVSFHKSLSVQPLDVDPNHLEIMFFKIWAQHQTVLLCVCYRPQWQGSEPIVFLQTHLDELLQLHTCNHVIIVGDMNQHLVARSFEELLTVHGLFNHVDFPTHISGSSLDPVVSDLPDSVVTCSPLSAVGSSDHMAILTLIQITPQRDAAVTRTNWLWGKADWNGLCNALQQEPWNSILVGDVNNQVHTFTHTLLKHQEQYVPCTPTLSSPSTSPGLATSVEWQLMKRVVPGDSTHALLPTLTRNAIDALCSHATSSAMGSTTLAKILKPNSAVVQWVARPV
ncbi:hypothetical protein C7M84_012936 [Penaeus vannamei]|uniref:Endonuclease/exonuclease/phosphatase domain-containing protein n=1 Tax=Penaeus vannamei TaxID=6689 RepID=A0A423SXA7_PENVA|nr:hypothetical protein C7M84_012936 [Penaeus vannamei]